MYGVVKHIVIWQGANVKFFHMICRMEQILNLPNDH